MNPSNKLGLLVTDVRHALSQSLSTRSRTSPPKRSNFLARPIVAVVDSRLRHIVSAENIDNMKIKYDEKYHWLAGTEVTEVQERARYLESKLNMSRKEMRESREQLDNVVERLRSITSELESTGRGDVKHLHLRQLEYETIQEEMKLQRRTHKNEYQERETFTLLMNAVRESHETERNYNQRIKMISLIGACMGPFVGYLFSARLNAMRFRRMEDIINKKLALLSFTTIGAIREIHGLDPEVVSEPEKRGMIKRVLEMYQYIKNMLIDAYKIAVLRSSEFIENFKQIDSPLQDAAQISRPVVNRPKMVDSSTQACITCAQPVVEKVIVERVVSEPAPRVNYSELEEFKTLLSSLKTIEGNQLGLKNLLISSQELQESNKIEVSVHASDDEIVEMLQSDQKKVRELLFSIKGLLGDSQVTFDKSISSLAGNVESLSKKITNNSELYVAGLEHSKIINDLAKALMDIKGNIDLIETYYMNDVNKQFEELTNIHGDLSGQILGVRDALLTHQETLQTINLNLLSADERQQNIQTKIDQLFEELTTMLSEIKSDTSIDSVLENIDSVSNRITDIKTVLSTASPVSEEKLTSLQESVSQSIDRVMKKVEASILAGKEAQSETVQRVSAILCNQITLQNSIQESANLQVEETLRAQESLKREEQILESIGPVSKELAGYPGAVPTEDKVCECGGIKMEATTQTSPETEDASVATTEEMESQIILTEDGFMKTENVDELEVEGVFPKEIIAEETEDVASEKEDSCEDVVSEREEDSSSGEAILEEEEEGDPLIPLGVAYSTFVILTTIIMLVLK